MKRYWWTRLYIQPLYILVIDRGHSPLPFYLEGNKNCTRVNSRYWEEGIAMISLVHTVRNRRSGGIAPLILLFDTR
jgi:hypothetical protein